MHSHGQKEIYDGSSVEGLLKVWFISLRILAFLTGKRWLPAVFSLRGGAKYA